MHFKNRTANALLSRKSLRGTPRNPSTRHRQPTAESEIRHPALYPTFEIDNIIEMIGGGCDFRVQELVAAVAPHVQSPSEGVQ
jgi:hypothetical protein